MASHIREIREMACSAELASEKRQTDRQRRTGGTARETERQKEISTNCASNQSTVLKDTLLVL